MPGTQADAMVVLDSVRKTFRLPSGEKLVAVELSHVRVDRGSRLAVVGPNGSGKTTLLHLISGLLRPDTGDVAIDGRNLGELCESGLDRFRATTVGYLLQGTHLIEGLTAQENVMSAMLFAGRKPAEQRDRSRELLDRYGVGHRARHRPHQMSGGERQRVALARALANDPPLILADEPMASLDRDSARTLASELTRLCAEEGRTLVAVTHHPERLDQGVEILRMIPAELAGEELR